MSCIPPFYVTRPDTPALRGARTVWLAGFSHAIRSGSADDVPYVAPYPRRTWLEGHACGAEWLSAHASLPGLERALEATR